jgi:microcystin-dependent protein
MALTWSLGENPKWYFADLTGKPLGGGTMYTYRSLDKTQQKVVFQDPGGNFPYPDPVLLDENGTAGPFYWQIDSSNTDETYYIEVYAANGVLQWTMDNYLPGGGGGGGGGGTTGLDFTNLIVNNSFWRGIQQSANPIASQNLFIAPGAHSNFPQSTMPGNLGDIRFIKSNTASTDQLTLVPFTLGLDAFNGDITPPVYLNYTCTAIGGGGETFKYVQFPISTDLQSTSNQAATVTIWARSTSGANTLALSFYQFFGDGGGASAAVTTLIQNITLTSAWAKYVITTTIPDVTAKNLGACQNTGLYIQAQYPLSQTTSIDFASLSCYLAPFAPDRDYLTQDQIDAVLNAPRTGDVRVSLNSFSPYGWVACNDGTIGNPSSNATTRANLDTFPLFDLIWNGVSNTLAPLLNSAGSPTARGASSMSDFSANNQISLTKVLGRALSSTGLPSSGGSGNSWPLGTAQGEELHLLSLGEIPNHQHTTLAGGLYTINQLAGSLSIPGGSTATTSQDTGGIFNYPGESGHNTIQPTTYFNVFLKL